MRRTAVALLVAAVAAPATAAAFDLTSTAFGAGEPIPPRHACAAGDDVSPPLTWTTPPAGSRSLALIVDDPDAPDPAAPRMVFVHWLLYNLPPVAGSLPAGVSASALPTGTRQGTNDFQRPGYRGPCPPTGRHRYFFRLYALDVVLPDLGAVTRSSLDTAMRGHVLAQTELMGTFEKS